MTPREIASQAAHAIAVLNELTHGGGELSNPGDVRAIVGSLELIGQGLPQLCEQLAGSSSSSRRTGSSPTRTALTRMTP